MGRKSLERISTWNFDANRDGLVAALEALINRYVANAA
jgi:hypothetical protein